MAGQQKANEGTYPRITPTSIKSCSLRTSSLYGRRQDGFMTVRRSTSSRTNQGRTSTSTPVKPATGGDRRSARPLSSTPLLPMLTRPSSSPPGRRPSRRPPGRQVTGGLSRRRASARGLQRLGRCRAVRRWSSAPPSTGSSRCAAAALKRPTVMPTWRHIILGMVDMGLGLQDVDCWPYSAAI